MPARSLFTSARAVKRWLRNPWTLTRLWFGDTLTNLGIGLGGMGERIAQRAIADLARKVSGHEKPRRS